MWHSIGVVTWNSKNHGKDLYFTNLRYKKESIFITGKYKRIRKQFMALFF